MTVITETDKVVLNVMTENQYANSVKSNTELYVVTDIDVQTTKNLVTSVNSTSTDQEYPSAKCVYDLFSTSDNYANKDLSNLTTLGSDRFVTKNTSQSISGQKTFSDTAIFEDYIQKTAYLRDLNQKTDGIYLQSTFSATQAGSQLSMVTGLHSTDVNGVMLNSLTFNYIANSNSKTSLFAESPNNQYTSKIELYAGNDGQVYATAPTPSISDNSNKITTTGYINNKFVVVSELPANPDSDIFYFITEEE